MFAGDVNGDGEREVPVRDIPNEPRSWEGMRSRVTINAWPTRSSHYPKAVSWRRTTPNLNTTSPTNGTRRLRARRGNRVPPCLTATPTTATPTVGNDATTATPTTATPSDRIGNDGNDEQRRHQRRQHQRRQHQRRQHQRLQHQRRQHHTPASTNDRESTSYSERGTDNNGDNGMSGLEVNTSQPASVYAPVQRLKLITPWKVKPSVW